MAQEPEGSESHEWAVDILEKQPFPYAVFTFEKSSEDLHTWISCFNLKNIDVSLTLAMQLRALADKLEGE